MRWFSSFSFVELSYIRLVEEKEMVARFGEAYLAYRRGVPFIVPRLRRSR
jgi:protein-S-isoprenylcysteine O-methyltransferase Ste14